MYACLDIPSQYNLRIFVSQRGVELSCQQHVVHPRGLGWPFARENFSFAEKHGPNDLSDDFDRSSGMVSEEWNIKAVRKSKCMARREGFASWIVISSEICNSYNEFQWPVVRHLLLLHCLYKLQTHVRFHFEIG